LRKIGRGDMVNGKGSMRSGYRTHVGGFKKPCIRRLAARKGSSEAKKRIIPVLGQEKGKRTLKITLSGAEGDQAGNCWGKKGR